MYILYFVLCVHFFTEGTRPREKPLCLAQWYRRGCVTYVTRRHDYVRKSGSSDLRVHANFHVRSHAMFTPQLRN